LSSLDGHFIANLLTNIANLLTNFAIATSLSPNVFKTITMIFGIICVLIISLIQTSLSVITSIPAPVVIGTIFLFVNHQISLNSGTPTMAETLKAVVAGVWTLLMVFPSSLDVILLRLCLGIAVIAGAVILALELEAFISSLLDRTCLKCYMLLLGVADLPPNNTVTKHATIIHVITHPVGPGSKKRGFVVGPKDGDLFWYSFFGSNGVTRDVAGCPSYDTEIRRPASDFKMIINLEPIVEEVGEEEETPEIEHGDTFLVDDHSGGVYVPSAAKTAPSSLLSLTTGPISVPVLRRSARLAGMRAAAAAAAEQESADVGKHSSSSALGSRFVSGRRRSARLASRTSHMS
jgi:hypothetical protein